MVRIHTINIRRIKTKMLTGIISIIIVLSIYKLTLTNSNDIRANLDYKEQRIDSEIYKQVLEETIPYVNGYSNDGHTSENFITNTIAFLTDIDLCQLNTILEQIIPFTTQIHRSSSQYTQNIIEIEGTFNDYKKNNDEIIHQNDEDFYQIDDESSETFEDPFRNAQIKYTETQLKNIDFLQRNLYNFEGNLKLTYSDIPAIALINRSISLHKESNKPQILIFHTHSQENFIDSKTKRLEEGVIGLGETLSKILHDKYGIGVLHNKGQYDVVNGKLNRDGSYERMEPAIRKILQQNPSIEVIIDLHRDGIENGKLLTVINGKPTAKIMLVNGICKTMKNGRLTEVSSLPNPYLKDNLAFSLQMQLKGNELYPGLMRKLYIKPYRYSLHMLPKSLLVEVGANTNTLEEAKNAMEPLAKILAEVLNLK